MKFKYILYIAGKSGTENKFILYALSLLPIQPYPKEFHKGIIGKAEKLIGKIDKKDVDILALVLKLRALLWSEDRDFERVEEITLLKTKDII